MYAYLLIIFIFYTICPYIGWFDQNNNNTNTNNTTTTTNTTTNNNSANELTTKVNDLTSKIEDGISRKLGDFIQYLSQFVAGYIVAFYFSWRLALVLLCSLPFISVSGSYMVAAMTSAQVYMFIVCYMYVYVLYILYIYIHIYMVYISYTYIIYALL